MALFVGRLALDTHARDLEGVFDKYGRLNRLEVKRGYAFVEYQDERDASDAMKDTDGMRLRGNRIVVEWAKNGGKKPGMSAYADNQCFKCGREGHWAKDCRSTARHGGGGGGAHRYRSRSPGRRRSSRSRSPPPRRPSPRRPSPRRDDRTEEREPRSTREDREPRDSRDDRADRADRADGRESRSSAAGVSGDSREDRGGSSYSSRRYSDEEKGAGDRRHAGGEPRFSH